MTIIGKQILNDFKLKHEDAAAWLDAWYAETEASEWNTPRNIKARYSSARFLSNNRVVLNVKGDNYRLGLKVNYQNKIVLIKKVGTHGEYERWKW